LRLWRRSLYEGLYKKGIFGSYQEFKLMFENDIPMTGIGGVILGVFVNVN
jgi:hypothetical protein